jgi:CDP-diacylglycerol--glycerol-3-phosphate 3-phosphatidyltransferase
MSRLLPNLITLLRPVLTVPIIVSILNDGDSVPVPLILSMIVFASDYMDGKIARRINGITRFGAVFDITADLIYIAATYGILVYLNIAPFWFLIVILLKFLEFIVTSRIIKKYSNSKSLFVFDFAGRITALMFYGAPLVIFLSYNLSMPIYRLIDSVILYLILITMIVSTVYRVWRCLIFARYNQRKHKASSDSRL